MNKYLGKRRFGIRPTVQAREVQLRRGILRPRQDSLAVRYARGKKSYPPTFFLHGTADMAVPVEQSYRMAGRLRGMGVPVGEAYCEGGLHCFEQAFEAG